MSDLWTIFCVILFIPVFFVLFCLLIWAFWVDRKKVHWGYRASLYSGDVSFIPGQKSHKYTS